VLTGLGADVYGEGGKGELVPHPQEPARLRTGACHRRVPSTSLDHVPAKQTPKSYLFQRNLSTCPVPSCLQGKAGVCLGRLLTRALRSSKLQLHKSSHWGAHQRDLADSKLQVRPASRKPCASRSVQAYFYLKWQHWMKNKSHELEHELHP